MSLRSAKHVPAISQPGFSLVEVMLILVLLSATVLPVTLVLSQTSLLTRSVYIQSTRSLFLANAVAQMDPLRSDYYALFNDSSMDTTLSESGQTIPVMTKMDTANSDTFTKTIYLYTYNAASDSTNSPRTIHTIFRSTGAFRLRCGSSSSLMDSTNQLWLGDGNAYDLTKKQPGYVTGSTGVTGSNVVDIVNTSGADDGLFQYYREGSSGGNVDYKFDVPNGDYLVGLYFAEVNATVTGSNPNRRLMDIYIEGTLKNSTAYSPYETTGGSYRGNVQTFTTTVADSVLDLSIRRNASSNNEVRISGIVLQKRRIE